MTDHDEVGLRPNSQWVRRVQSERRARTANHEVSIPSGLVFELLHIAQELREQAAYVEPYSDTHASALRTCAALRSCAVRIQAIAEQANT